MEQKTVVIGITGGIGTGKSEVAKIIRDKGYVVLSSDEIAKDLMANDDNLKTNLKNLFGDKVYDESGSLNKSFLASKIFGNSEIHKDNLNRMNALVHPRVIEELINKAEHYSHQGEEMIFNESALIFEAGLDEGYDAIIVVDAPEDLRVERVMKSRGMSKEEILKRMDEQISQHEKKKAADFVIDNSGDINQLKQSVEFILQVAKAIEPKDFTKLKREEEEL
jgi:dephospho-CoA kinase